MKKPEREYPDIEFLETDTETIESNMIALYEELVNKELVKQGKREKYREALTAGCLSLHSALPPSSSSQHSG